MTQLPSLEPLQIIGQLDPSKIDWYKGFRRPIIDILADLSKTIPWGKLV